MNIEQAKQAVTQAEENLKAAEQALKTTEAARSAVRGELQEALETNQPAETVDALRLKLIAFGGTANPGTVDSAQTGVDAGGHLWVAHLNVQRAEEVLAHARTVLKHVSAHKRWYEAVTRGAARVASIDAEIRVIAGEAQARMLRLLEQRDAVLQETRAAYASIPGEVLAAVDPGGDPCPALQVTGVLGALGSIAANPN